MEIASGFRPETVWILEHEHVYTCPKSKCALQDINGIPVVMTKRGGDITYHGPGQLIIYPMIKIRDIGIHEYIYALEEIAILLIGKEAYRTPEHRGVWAYGKKIASVGVHASKGVTSHGIAINVSTDLLYFDSIVPCGIIGCKMTSMRAIGMSVDNLHERVSYLTSKMRLAFDGKHMRKLACINNK